MTLSALRAWLEPRVPEEGFSPDVVKTALNGGLHHVSRLILSVVADYFVRPRRFSLYHGVSYYPIKLDTKHVHEVWQLDPTSGLYRPLDYLSWRHVSARASKTTGQSSTTRAVWTRRGRYIYLHPQPDLTGMTGTQTDPLRLDDGLHVVESFVPSFDKEDDEPPIDVDLHLAIASRAHRLLLPATAEWAELATALDEEFLRCWEGWRESYFAVAEADILDVDDPGYPGPE